MIGNKQYIHFKLLAFDLKLPDIFSSNDLQFFFSDCTRARPILKIFIYTRCVIEVYSSLKLTLFTNYLALYAENNNK